MSEAAREKVLAQHLSRKAYLYIRQSTMRQTQSHQESTRRQYGLQDRAKALGWSREDIIIVDEDQGQSAASTGREGFQRLVAEVGLGHAGIVMSLEASRLARNSSDWHRLLEICAVTATLILDEDGLYDPAHFNDRLLLGLKGTMSEVELHMLRSRLMGGRMNKARRGELRIRLPVGFIYDSQGKVRVDPDKRVQESIRMLFRTYVRVGGVFRTVKEINTQEMEFPRRIHEGPSKGELFWGPLTISQARYILHNPRYAGAYVYRRRRHRRRGLDGRVVVEWLPREDWHTLIKDAHEGYISWEEYEENQKRFRANAVRSQPWASPPREGPALLQGLAVCGVCGRKMDVRYHRRNGRLEPDYTCRGEGYKFGNPVCQGISGGSLDDEVGRLLVEAMSPVALEVALAVQQELQDRAEEADGLRRKKVESARYEAELARRRFLRVDPDNRLVADVLEAEWNARLREHAEAVEEYERLREKDRKILSDETRAKVISLATDFPRLWRNPQTSHRERKRMVRLLVEDVVLIKGKKLRMHVRFKGGATKTIELPKPQAAWETWTTDAGVVAEIDRLLDHHTYGEIAAKLNGQGFVSGQGRKFDGRRVNVIRRSYGLKSRYERLREAGLMTSKELAERLGISSSGVRARRRRGSLKAYRVYDSRQCLYEDCTKTSLLEDNVTERTKEVQYE